ncbi:MAG: AsmA family protein, partial [Bdellovibrionales bacterium]|nr:AsmA family protein [Massilia sp.]
MRKNSNALNIGGIILAAILGLIVLFALFDWNMARPYINRKVSESTGRQFAIRGKLDVGFRRGPDTDQGWRRYAPRAYVSAEDIHMSNPAWSTVGNEMAAAKRVDVGLRILPLLSKQFVITELRLDSPQVALQRRKDGANSWTLNDSGRSTWTVDIQSLAFSSGALRYLDEAIGLDLRADA